jgi:hypothetical protein
MKPLLWIFGFALGHCRHSHLSRVLTIEKRTYQVCLKCGEKFDYSWTLMRPVRSSVADGASALPNSIRHADASAFDPVAHRHHNLAS